MKKGDVVAGIYTVLDTVDGGGKSQSYKVSKDGEVLFLKRFTAPIYPKHVDGFSRKEIEDKKRVADAFEERHREIMRRLREPIAGGGNLVKPLAFFREGACYYKVYPFVQAKSCMSILNNRADKKMLFVKTFLLCLRELHAKDIVHSDLKPDNILLETMPAGMVAKLIDFDEAYLSGKPPEPPRRMGGDADYYSPELHEHKRTNGKSGVPLTTKSDIFSAAEVIQLVTTRNHPEVDGGSGESLAERIATGGIVRTSSLPRPFSDSFSHLVHQAMVANPSSRPSVEHLLEALGVEMPKAPSRVQSSIGRRGPRPPF